MMSVSYLDVVRSPYPIGGEEFVQMRWIIFLPDLAREFIRHVISNNMHREYKLIDPKGELG